MCISLFNISENQVIQLAIKGLEEIKEHISELLN